MQSKPLFIFHHGAGFSKESFTLLENELHILNLETLSFDCRGHGSNPIDSDDYSLDALVNDMIAVVGDHLKNKVGSDIILVGHSMGGPVCVELALRKIFKVIGVVVLDVVEGSAIESLVYMKSMLNSRPTTFQSIEEAVDYMVTSGQIRNRKSAILSVPSTLKQVDGHYEWRTNLAKTEKYWNQWFADLSSKFLSLRGAKLLVLAGTDRLDKTLLIGQMQGKFQLEIMADSGHSINQDCPEKLAHMLHLFYLRNQPLDISKIKKVT